ncbi:trihelix transcription factor DF1-like [Musa acuminata AAA Group]|uniref:trihelix transcription factor DF1-like n=1 Tax=Musa acuminata AAA Group TaxID=214697 RepID=UPI0031D9D021
MQSGYGGVSEIQKFMVDSCGSSLFSISSANPTTVGAGAVDTPTTDIHSAALHPLKYHPLPQPHQPQPQASPPLPPHFSHFHSVSITQQLFHHPAHQFQLFHPQQQYLEPRQLIPQHQLGLDHEPAPENSSSPTRIIPGSSGGGGPSFLTAAMSFKLSVNDSSGGGGGNREGINDNDSILQGDDGSESRLHHWQREDESSIKELSWRPLDLDYINRNHKRCKDKEAETSNSKHCRKNKEVDETEDVQVAGGSNYKIFSELEAIYNKPGGGANQTGSGSALTGDEAPLLHATTVAAPGPPAADEEEEATAKKLSKGSGRRRRKWRQRQLSSVAAFFEDLVKQLMDHQEGLHRQFLDVMERREQQRISREEAWRKQQVAKSSREAATRAQERALASSREAAIISFIEKFTGESINLPCNLPFPSHMPDADADKEDHTNTPNNLQIEPSSDTFNNGDPGSSKMSFNTSRWPKAEVQALIRVRSGLESRFQEPGLKGPLWEEVSATMATMGYHRCAKRCKEKWENINKYFRKTKERGKKRPQHSKTCPYFQQLDQLYSKSLNTNPITSTSSPNATNVSTIAAASGANEGQRKDNSELLDAIVVPADHQSFRFSDMAALGFDFNSRGDDSDQAGGGGGGTAAEGPLEPRVSEDNNDEEDDDQGGGDEEGEDEEREGDSQRLHQLDQEEEDLHDSSLFFQRLRS